MAIKLRLEKKNTGQKEEVCVKDIFFPPEEHKSLRKRTTIITHRVSDDATRFDKGDYVFAEEIDENYCFEVTAKKVITNIKDSPYYDELTSGQISYLKGFDNIAVLTLEKTKYERPYKLSSIQKSYPPAVYEKLKRDEVHSWRARTGIELIHLEPTQAEQQRTYKNWHLMPQYLKTVSDAKCVELFGVTNEEHYKIVKDERNASDDPIFRLVVRLYKSIFGFDLTGYRLVLTKTPRYTNGKPADFPLEQFGGCWTNKHVVYLNSNLKPVIKFYNCKNTSEDALKKTILAHELGHGVYNELADTAFKTKVVKLAKSKHFSTEYLDFVKVDNPGKLKEETFCEFLAAVICGTVKLVLGDLK